jgi:hypothetical protein
VPADIIISGGIADILIKSAVSMLIKLNCDISAKRDYVSTAIFAARRIDC